MPELPEVETTVRALRGAIVGKKITGAHASAHQLFESHAIFRSIGAMLERDSIERIERHGKYLLFYLKSGRIMVAHMKMTGSFLATNNKLPIANNYIRFALDFIDGSTLLFSDIRKFGRFWIFPKEKLPDFIREKNLAHDALSSLCTLDYLQSQLKKNRAVKTLLLDQTRIAGIGNIYADEILWKAKIHPLKKGNTLARKEVKKIFAAIRSTLLAGIRAGGTSVRDYIRPDGTRGSFQNVKNVYGRTGERCRRCGAIVRRLVIAQRSSHFCPKCQHS